MVRNWWRIPRKLPIVHPRIFRELHVSFAKANMDEPVPTMAADYIKNKNKLAMHVPLPVMA
jgi:hypothetical protein